MKPELLAPAGSLEKLKVAITYGATAVYLGGEKFGLRSAAQNFSLEEMAEGVRFAHLHQAKVYVVVNGFLFDHEIEQLPVFARACEAIGVDAFIVSDLGSVQTLAAVCKVPLHLSTQASCLNSEAAQFWKAFGIKRVILGRETSLKEASAIKKKTGLEVELFVHGALCMSYSGHCVISNYTQGRDSNRGGCAQSCRFQYGLQIHTDKGQGENAQTDCKTTFLSSKDLMAISLIGEMEKENIDSIKIEGRMKTHLYVGLTTKIYREVLDYGSRATAEDWTYWQDQLQSYSHREYTSSGLSGDQDPKSVFAQEDALEAESKFLGVILEVRLDKAVVELRGNLRVGDCVDWISVSGPHQIMKIDWIQNVRGQNIEKANPNQVVVIQAVGAMKAQTLLRKQVSERSVPK